MTPLHNNTIPPVLCSYDSSYYDIYQPSYGTSFIFSDEEEENDYSDFDRDDLFTPSGLA